MATKKKKMKSPLECWLTMVFNEWMRRYIDDPKAFAAEFASVISFRDDEDAGKIPSYGDSCARYMTKLGTDIAKSAAKSRRSMRKNKPMATNIEVSASVTSATKRRRISAGKR